MTWRERTAELLKKYKHGWVFSYFLVYMPWFLYLEKHVTKNYHVIHSAIDDEIPFIEYFIVPYLLWFVYVAATVAFFFLKDKDDYFKCCAFLFTGMTVFLLVSTLWPNGHHLRPFIFPRENIFTRLVAMIYRADTPTNLWPSIHVYNSLGCHFAIAKSRHFAQHKGIRFGSLVLCVSIVLSTMFTKQHSAFDVMTALILASVMYLLVYRFDILLNLKHSINHKNKRKMGPETL